MSEHLIIYGDLIEQEAINQIYTLAKTEAYKNNIIRVMPDCHAGKVCTVGTTMIITDKITPNLVGVDIGCTVSAYHITLPKGVTNAREWFDSIKEKLDNVIREHVPSGMNIRASMNDVPKHIIKDVEMFLDKIIASVTKDRALYSLGTLGGGNHFISVEFDENTNDVYLLIHCGSRHLGVEVCKYWQNVAINDRRTHKGDIQKLITQLKQEGREREIQDEIKKIQRPPISNELSYLDKNLEPAHFEGYLNDMMICQSFASYNHDTIWNVISHYMNWSSDFKIKTMHNYIEQINRNAFYDTDTFQPFDYMYVLRKGAVAAYRNDRLIIPMNMRDGSLICIGKSNLEWNCSAPHGAGRVMSRSRAKEELKMSEFVTSMKDVYSTSVNESTIDEAPMAYKPMQSIIDAIGDTVEIVQQIKPLYNFKANG